MSIDTINEPNASLGDDSMDDSTRIGRAIKDLQAEYSSFEDDRSLGHSQRLLALAVLKSGIYYLEERQR